MLSVALPSPLSLCPVCCLVTLAGQNYTQISWLLPPCPLSPFKGRTTQGSLSRRTVVFRNKDNLILYSHHISQVWSLGSNLFSFMKFPVLLWLPSPHILKSNSPHYAISFESLSCSLIGCNFLISQMEDLDKTYNKNQLSNKILCGHPACET